MGTQTLLVSIGAVAICLLLPLTLVTLTLFRPMSKEIKEQLAEVNDAKSAAMHDLLDASKHGHLPDSSGNTKIENGGSRDAGAMSVSALKNGGGSTSRSSDYGGGDVQKNTDSNKPVSNKLDAKHHRELAHLWSAKPKNAMDLHFIHIPKCGGTSMTSILRQVACEVDTERNEDCCTNPGFCDWHAHRRCASIKGCINHFPQTEWIYKAPPSITIMREPMSRLLSAWFYRGHSPNLDFFQVRPWFKEIKEGKRPRVTFAEYLEMPEYNNIQTRMLGGNSFPYKNVTVTQQLYETALSALDNMYFIGLQEVYDLSVKVMLRELNYKGKLEVVKERDQAANRKIRKEKAAIRSNATLVARINQVNGWDRELYREAVRRFCATAAKYPDLYKLVLSSGKVHC